MLLGHSPSVEEATALLGLKPAGGGAIGKPKPFRLNQQCFQHWDGAVSAPTACPCTQSHSHAWGCRELPSCCTHPTAALEALQRFCLQSGQVLTSESGVWQTWAPEPRVSPQLEQRALKRSAQAGSKWLENWKGGLL